MKIMFVCLGNICRSPLAHAVFESIVNENQTEEEIKVESSGTSAYHIGDEADSRMINTARGHGVTISHAARQLKETDLIEYDLIFAMDRQNYRDIAKLTDDKDLLNKVHLFREFDPADTNSKDVPDPYFGGLNGFEEVYTIVKRTCDNIYNNLPSIKES